MDEIILKNEIAIMRALQCLLRIADSQGHGMNALTGYGVPLEWRIEATSAALIESAKHQSDTRTPASNPTQPRPEQPRFDRGGQL